MKKFNNVFVSGLLAVAFAGVDVEASTNAHYRLLKCGQIYPEGWIKEQMRLDLQQGYYPDYDKIKPPIDQDLFGKNKRISPRKYDGRAGWWPGEWEAFWKDGMTRLAFLSGDEQSLERVKGWMDHVLACQDDGYIGIYQAGETDGCRYRHVGENGELWTQSRMMQALIAYSEFTGDPRYFDAARQTMDLTISRFGKPYNYFVQGAGGIGHGVGLFEPLYYFYQTTGDRRYADFAVHLYEDFSSAKVRDNDLQYGNLMSTNRFMKHGAHLAEGLSMPFFVALADPSGKYREAAEQVFTKLDYHLTPGGALTCAEFVGGRAGTGEMDCEYCGMAQMINPLSQIAAMTGNMHAADLAEKIVLNAAQAARLPVLKAAAYVSRDNRKEIDPASKGQRESYAATHQAAACCTFNAGRLMPYYVAGMWMQDSCHPGLTAVLYGPCRVAADISGIPVSIEEKTGYPFSDQVLFEVNPAKPVRFTLSLRIPASAEDVKISGAETAEIRRDGRLMRIDRVWKPGDRIVAEMVFPVRMVAQNKEPGSTKPDEYYIQRGPLVYSLPFPYAINEANNINQSGHWLYRIETTDATGWDYRLPGDSEFRLETCTDGDPLHPYAKPPIALRGQMVDVQGMKTDVNLVPHGSTVMRRLTFPVVRPFPNK